MEYQKYKGGREAVLQLPFVQGSLSKCHQPHLVRQVKLHCV